jgi:hypothetical protein
MVVSVLAGLFCAACRGTPTAADAARGDGRAADLTRSDATAPDGWPVEAGATDAGKADAGTVDAGRLDVGPLDGRVTDVHAGEQRLADHGGRDLRAADGGMSDGSTACAAEVAALADEIYAELGRSSTVVVRLDHDTRALLGFQMFIGRYARVTEAQARATAQIDTGYGAIGKMLNPADPEDAYVFYEAPGDFGGAAAVSAHTGLSVFGGSIIWAGSGEITYPASWRPVAGLGVNCPKVGRIPTSRGYDLVAGAPLGQADIDQALAVVEKTAVPAAIWQGGYLFDAVVLRYPRSVGLFIPATAEWIVLISGGWLE